MWCIWLFEEFWVTQNLGQSILVTTPYCQCLLPLTNYGDQFQQWTLFTLKQYCLEGILAKESSPRTKDFLLWRDLHPTNLKLLCGMSSCDNDIRFTPECWRPFSQTPGNALNKTLTTLYVYLSSVTKKIIK